MRFCNQGRFREQVSFLRRQFLQDEDLPFGDVLTDDFVAQAMTAIEGVWKDRIYTPLVTLWVFLGQVLSADHSCRAAVARLIAHRLSRGESACSAETGAYCQARKRLPEKFFSAVTCWLDARWMPRLIRSGCGKDVESTCSTARRSPCPTHRRIKEPIRKTWSKSLVWAFPSRGSA